MKIRASNFVIYGGIFALLILVGIPVVAIIGEAPPWVVLFFSVIFMPGAVFIPTTWASLIIE